MFKEKSGGEMELGGSESYLDNPIPIESTNNLGNITVSYIGFITPYINNTEAVWNEQQG